MKLLGGLMLTAAGLCGGILAVRRDRARLQMCRSLCQMLRLISFQLERFLTPLPELFTVLSGQVTGGAAAICSAMAEGLSEPGGSFAEHWAEALNALPDREKEILLPLGQVLGRYAAAEQTAAVAAALHDMTELGDTLSQQLGEKSRVYIGLSAAGSAMLAVLLM